MTDAPSRAEANRRTYDDARLAAIYDVDNPAGEAPGSVLAGQQVAGGLGGALEQGVVPAAGPGGVVGHRAHRIGRVRVGSTAAPRCATWLAGSSA